MTRAEIINAIAFFKKSGQPPQFWHEFLFKFTEGLVEIRANSVAVACRDGWTSSYTCGVYYDAIYGNERMDLLDLRKRGGLVKMDYTNGLPVLKEGHDLFSLSGAEGLKNLFAALKDLGFKIKKTQNHEKPRVIIDGHDATHRHPELLDLNYQVPTPLSGEDGVGYVDC